MKLCDFGCDEKAIFKLRNGKRCCNGCPKVGNIYFITNCNNPKGWTKSEYYHNKAWELFGKDKCEVCGISLKEYKHKYNERLHMHNTLEPKDYTIMEAHAWQCLCNGCHTRIEHTINIYNNSRKFFYVSRHESV